MRTMKRNLFVLILSTMPILAAFGSTGFIDKDITEWPRSYPHYTNWVWQYNPRLASNGDDFLLAWYEQHHIEEHVTSDDVYVCRLTQEGVPLDTNGIYIAHCGAYNDQDMEPAVCSIGNDYWVLYGYYGYYEYVYGRRVAASGELGEQILIGDSEGLATITSLAADTTSSTNMLVSWFVSGADTIKYSLLNPQTTNFIVESESLFATNDISDHITATASGSKYLVVFYQGLIHSSGTGKNLMALRIEGDGTILDTQPIVIANDEFIDYRKAAFDTVATDDGWLIVYDGGWTDIELRAVSLSHDGIVSSNAPIYYEDFEGMPMRELQVERLPSGYVIAWSQQRGYGYSPRLLLFDSSFSVQSVEYLPATNAFHKSASQMQIAQNEHGNFVGVWRHFNEFIVSPPDNIENLRGGMLVPQPKLTGISSDGTNVFCNAQVRGEATNTLQHVDHLTNSSWNVASNASHYSKYPELLSFTNNVEGITSRFYRILESSTTP